MWQKRVNEIDALVWKILILDCEKPKVYKFSH